MRDERLPTLRKVGGRDDIAAFFAGWDLVRPGLVEIELWHPEAGREAGDGVTELGGVARKA